VTAGLVEVLFEESSKENKFLKDETRHGMLALIQHLHQEYAAEMAQVPPHPRKALRGYCKVNS